MMPHITEIINSATIFTEHIAGPKEAEEKHTKRMEENEDMQVVALVS